MVMRLRSDRGFSLTEMMLTVAMIATVAAISVPVMTDVTGNIRINEAARVVERELQDARLRAVSANRPLRVRFNCPSEGFIRTVEFLNTSADTATNRCQTAAYPYPAADTDVMTRPNYDGPVRVLPSSATVETRTLEFLPDGTARSVVSNVATTITTPVTITVSRLGRTRSVTINGAGKIQLQ